MRTYLLGITMAATLLVPFAAASTDSNPNRKSAQQVADNLKQSGQLKDYRVGVKYQDGVAWLTGSVTNDRQRALAEQIARRSAGVEQVISNLTIQAAPKAKKAPAVSKKMPSSQQANLVRDDLERTSSPDKNVIPVSTKKTPPRNSAKRRPNGQSSQMPRAAQSRQPNQFTQNRMVKRAAGRIPSQNTPVPYARSGQGVHPASYGAPTAMGAAPMPAAGGGRAVSYDNPQMPGYAWPSYAANPNYAALTYPQQYSPSAWPYIGPFYPYPQVPLGWRKVTLEWDDGWWFLDFKDSRRGR
jgi:hypothetical protein